MRGFCLLHWALRLVGCSADLTPIQERVMALGTGQRNIAAALVVASQSFSDPKVVVMVIVVAIVGLIILMPLSRALASLLSRYGMVVRRWLCIILWGVAYEPAHYGRLCAVESLPYCLAASTIFGSRIVKVEPRPGSSQRRGGGGCAQEVAASGFSELIV